MPNRHPYKRAERVADLLRQVVSELLMTKIHHAGLDDLTVTGVKITDDLQHAKVFYRVIHPEHRLKVAKQIPKILRQLRKDVGHEMKMRYAPELKFEYDESLEYGHRIDSLLKTIKSPNGEEE